MRETEAYSMNVYVARDGSKSLPLRYLMFVITSLIQSHSTWHRPWVMQINIVEGLK